MSTDIVKTYFPSFAELADADILDMRNRLSDLLHSEYPDIDFRPGSPLGDLVLTPFAHLACAQETAMNRFMSDLDLENVAKGVIYNCDFVTLFLQNFAVVAQTTLQSSGIVRLTFTVNQAYEIDRRAQYQFGDNNVFQLRLPNPGPLEIYPVGVPLAAGVNARNLVELTPGVWVADIPVTGVMTTQVLSGDTGTTDYPIDEVSDIVALADFDFGLPPESLSILAQKTRDTFYSSTPNTRGGAAQFLQKEFPQLVGNSPIITGDPEMIRDTVNPLGLANGKLDLYPRSNVTVNESQVIRVPFYPAQGNLFIAKLSFTNIPFALDSVIAAGATSLILAPTTFSRSQNAAVAPMVSAAYSALEDLWLAIPMPYDTGNNALIPLDTATDGSQSALFTLNYRYDPILQPIIDLLNSPTVTPPGVGTLVRGFVPIMISSMTIRYTRARGTTVLVDQAQTEILNYINNLAQPKIYTDTKVADSMYYAGAQDVTAIDVLASVQWSIGQRILTPTAPDPSADYNGALAASYLPHPITISGSKALAPLYRDVNLGSANATYEACGPGNVVLVLPAENLFFNEVV